MKTSTVNASMKLIMFFIMITNSIGYAQENIFKGIYFSLQPGYVTIHEKEVKDPPAVYPFQEPSEFNRIAMGLDTQLGWAVSPTLNLHSTLVLTLGETLTFPIGAVTTVDLAGGGVTYYFKNKFFLTGNLGTSYSKRNEPYFTEFKNGFAYQFKAGKEWKPIDFWAAFGIALEYGGYSTKCWTDYDQQKTTFQRFGIRVTISRYGKG